MPHHHTFGRAGGAGGVDDVGQVLRRNVYLRIVCVTVAVVGQQHLQVLGLQETIAQMRLGQQHPGIAVFEHERQAVRRELRIKWHIGATGLEGRQQADHHVQGALHMHRHQHVGADARRDQPVRQAIGPAVEFGVAQADVIEAQCDGIRAGERLRLEHLVHALFARVIGWRVVPRLHHLLPLRRTEHRQLVERL
ncbi:hypothetical protein [Pseudomonas sp. 37 R 15]|nr:hypothetical protein [Pseudomonas sp. 37 R 15]